MELLGNNDVSIVYARKQEMVRMKKKKRKKIPEGTSYVEFVALIVQWYFDTLLRYVLSVTFCGAAVLNVMDQKTVLICADDFIAWE